MKLIQDWIKALRSGDYEQGTGSLRQDNRYCCLGVITELDPRFEFDETYDELYHADTIRDDVPDEDLYSLNMEYEPDLIADETGLAGPPPAWLLALTNKEEPKQPSQIDHALALLNDAGKNFEEIADIVQQLYNEGYLKDPVIT